MKQPRKYAASSTLNTITLWCISLRNRKHLWRRQFFRETFPRMLGIAAVPTQKKKSEEDVAKKTRKNKTAHPLQHSRIKLLLDFPRLNRYTLFSGTQLDVLKAPNPLLWNPPNAISSPNRLNVYDSLTFMLRVGEPSSFGALHPKGTEDATRTRKKG